MADVDFRRAEALDFLRGLEDSSVDLLLTDPPYNVELEYDEYSDDLAPEEYWSWMEEIFQEVERVLKPSGCAAVVTPHNRLRKWLSLVDDSGLRELNGSPVIWHRPNHVGFQSRGYNHTTYPIHVLAGEEHEVLNPPKSSGVTTFNFVKATGPQSDFNGVQEKVHPAQQPVRVYEKFVLKNCPSGGLVVDPFLGSGTSAMAAKKWGRNFKGCDISREYIEKARERVSKVSTQKIYVQEKLGGERP